MNAKKGWNNQVPKVDPRASVSHPRSISELQVVSFCYIFAFDKTSKVWIFLAKSKWNHIKFKKNNPNGPKKVLWRITIEIWNIVVELWFKKKIDMASMKPVSGLLLLKKVWTKRGIFIINSTFCKWFFNLAQFSNNRATKNSTV